MFCLECYGKGFLLEKLLQVCLHAPQNFLIIYDEISSGTFENIIFNISTSFETTQIISSAICSSPPPSRCRQKRYFYQQRREKENSKTCKKNFRFSFFSANCTAEALMKPTHFFTSFVWHFSSTTRNLQESSDSERKKCF